MSASGSADRATQLSRADNATADIEALPDAA